MIEGLDIRPSSKDTLVDVIIYNHLSSWKDLILSSVADDYKIRIFTVPIRRAKHIRNFYWAFRKVYPAFSVEAVNYGFQMYLLGWIEPYQLVSVVRNFGKEPTSLDLL